MSFLNDKTNFPIDKVNQSLTMLNNALRNKRRRFEEYANSGGSDFGVDLFDAIVALDDDYKDGRTTVSTIAVGDQRAVRDALRNMAVALREVTDLDTYDHFSDRMEQNWDDFISTALDYLTEGGARLKRAALVVPRLERANTCYAAGCNMRMNRLSGLCEDHDGDFQYRLAALRGIDV